MTENEAISVLKMIEAHGSLSSKAREMSIQSLEEIQQYRAIGTVEEFKALKEKNEPKKPIEIKCGCYGITKNGRKGYLIKNKCPNCGSEELMNSFPCRCGQKLDWQ
jgi:hypothetical protein